MTEKDINIEGEELKEEQPVEETDKEAESETAENKDESDEEAAEDPLEKAQAEIADLKNQLLYKVAEFDNYRSAHSKRRLN